MRATTKKRICFAALIAMLVGCRGIDNPEGDLKGINYQFLFTQKGAEMIDESGYFAIRR